MADKNVTIILMSKENGIDGEMVQIPLADALALIEGKAVIVPIEPSEEMLEAAIDDSMKMTQEAYESRLYFTEIYKAMNNKRRRSDVHKLFKQN